MKIYVASSWKNLYQPMVVQTLRKLGHTVYDFRNPADDDYGFSWKQVDPEYRGQAISVTQWKNLLKHPIAEHGYKNDITALKECEALVYVLPCGRSASWEFGYTCGQGKRTFVLALESVEPDLMFREVPILDSMAHLVRIFRPIPLATCPMCQHPEGELFRGLWDSNHQSYWVDCHNCKSLGHNSTPPTYNIDIPVE